MFLPRTCLLFFLCELAEQFCEPLGHRRANLSESVSGKLTYNTGDMSVAFGQGICPIFGPMPHSETPFLKRISFLICLPAHFFH